METFLSSFFILINIFLKADFLTKSKFELIQRNKIPKLLEMKIKKSRLILPKYIFVNG